MLASIWTRFLNSDKIGDLRLIIGLLIPFLKVLQKDTLGQDFDSCKYK